MPKSRQATVRRALRGAVVFLREERNELMRGCCLISKRTNQPRLKTMMAAVKPRFNRLTRTINLIDRGLASGR